MLVVVLFIACPALALVPFVVVDAIREALE